MHTVLPEMEILFQLLRSRIRAAIYPQLPGSDTLQHTETDCSTDCNTHFNTHCNTHCSMLLHTRQHTLQHAAICCNSLSTRIRRTTYPQLPGSNKLQHTLIHCNTHQHTATHYNNLSTRIQRAAYPQLRINTLHQDTATQMNTLQHTSTTYPQLPGSNTLQQHTATHCAHCNTRPHTATHCNTPQQLTHNYQVGVSKRLVSVVAVPFWGTATKLHCATHCNKRKQAFEQAFQKACSKNTVFTTDLFDIVFHCNTRPHTATHCNIPQQLTHNYQVGVSKRTSKRLVQKTLSSKQTYLTLCFIVQNCVKCFASQFTPPRHPSRYNCVLMSVAKSVAQGNFVRVA